MKRVRNVKMHLVILNKRGNACPKCLPFVGKVLIDDVWSGGSSADGNYPLMSAAIEAGLYHPNCKDGHTTYFPELTEIEDKYSSKEMQQLTADYQAEQRDKYIQNMIDRYQRLADNSLDPDNKKKYEARVGDLKSKLTGSSEKALVKDNQSDIIKAKKVVSGHNTTPLQSDANDIIDHIGKDGKIETRSFYDSDGKKIKDVTNHNHGNSKQHPYGNHGEHAHDYVWKDGIVVNREPRELTDVERKENGDIL